MTSTNHVFFLGGRDLEMKVISDLVADVLGPGHVTDKGLGWGARASAYEVEILAAAAAGQIPVLVELLIDIPLPAPALIVDHHGDRAEGPTSLEQIFALLDLPPDRWTRNHGLVAANDRGHVAGLKAFGASDAEAADIRAADRAAQGITEAQERQGLEALRKASEIADTGILIVELAHDRTATVTDPLALEPEFRDLPRELLVIAPGERAFFGAGERVQLLDKAFPGGWTGGDLPERGFWGHGGPDMPSAAELVSRLSGKPGVK